MKSNSALQALLPSFAAICQRSVGFSNSSESALVGKIGVPRQLKLEFAIDLDDRLPSLGRLGRERSSPMVVTMRCPDLLSPIQDVLKFDGLTFEASPADGSGR